MPSSTCAHEWRASENCANCVANCALLACASHTSGAMYDGVPQKVEAPLSSDVTASFASPKSERQTWPSASSRMFSGLRSR